MKQLTRLARVWGDLRGGWLGNSRELSSSCAGDTPRPAASVNKEKVHFSRINSEMLFWCPCLVLSPNYFYNAGCSFGFGGAISHCLEDCDKFVLYPRQPAPSHNSVVLEESSEATRVLKSHD